ncbi:MAG: peptide deformylase [Clostridiales bacterium]|jgi:peptide deformylase|nr:peptide deformylase [Clostridiales bacterium]
MGYRKIVTVGDPILKKRSRTVTSFDLKLAALLDDMKETLVREQGCGLAAVQVGVLRRVVVMNCGDGFIELVNPEIISSEGRQEQEEGCLSVPNERGITLRPSVVKVKAQDRNGRWRIYKGADLKARCFCHEIDHLDGILFTSRIIRREKP